jgi:hypothetical protein
MLSLAAKSELSPREVLDRAARFFADEGLSVTSRDSTSISLQGPGGGVTVTTSAPGSGATEVEIASREYDAVALRFVRQIQPPGVFGRLFRKLVGRGRKPSAELPIYREPADRG